MVRLGPQADWRADIGFLAYTKLVSGSGGGMEAPLHLEPPAVPSPSRATFKTADPWTMAKLLLLSVVIMMIAIPVLAARDRNAKRGLQKAILLVVVFNIFYVLALRYLYPHLL